MWYIGELGIKFLLWWERFAYAIYCPWIWNYRGRFYQKSADEGNKVIENIVA